MLIILSSLLFLIGVAYMVTIPRYSGFVMVAVLGVIIVSCSGVFPEKRSFVILALNCIAGLVVLAVLNIIKDYIIKYIRKRFMAKTDK